MNHNICFLYGAGDHDGTCPVDIREDDYIIAVDGGYDHIVKCGIVPDLVIGDFDSVCDPSAFTSTQTTDTVHSVAENKSCQSGTSDNLRSASYGVLRFPPEKDYTDMHLGVLEGKKAGYDTFVIYGGTGGRIDHTLANIELITWLSKEGCRGYLIGNGQVITAITDSELTFDDHSVKDRCLSLFCPDPVRYISVFSHSDRSKQVTIKGLEYNVDNIDLTNTYALGTSNRYLDQNYSISVKRGTLIIVSELV